MTPTNRRCRAGRVAPRTPSDRRGLRQLFLTLCLIPAFGWAVNLPAAQSFNVFTYGATGNGVSLDTLAVQRAIDAAASAGSNAEVLLPQGFSFLVGTLQLPGGIDFHLDGELIASTNQADYASDSLIISSNAANFTIRGMGGISGRSLSFMTNYDKTGERWLPAPWRPQMFALTGCSNLSIRDITFGDAPGGGLHLLGCYNVVVDHVTVRNRLDVPGCGGIAADHCQLVEIRNCDVITSDDPIVIESTRQAVDYGPGAHVLVRDCSVQTQGAGLGIGPETMSDIDDVVFERCRVLSASRGLSIQLRDEGRVSNVTFRDIQFISRYYADSWPGRGEGISLTAIPRTTETKLGLMKNIVFTNITGRAENSLRLNGSAGSHISNVQLDNVLVTLDRWTKYVGGHYDNRPTKTLEPIEPHVTAGMNIRYADGVRLKNVTLRWGKNLPDYFTYALETDQVTALELWGFKGGSAHPGIYADMLLR